MQHQTLLPLTPSGVVLPSPGGAFSPSNDSRRSGQGNVRYRPSNAKAAFRRRHSSLDGRHTRRVTALEPYRGREWPFLEPAREVRGGRQILVRTGAAEALRRALSGAPGIGSGPIEIGAAFEPYPSVESRLALTRAVLEVLCEARGLELSLTTRSPLVLRDQDLLRQLDLNHTVTVHVPIATLDNRLADRIEPGGFDPRSKLEVVRTLTADGIATKILCDPVLPGINSSADELDPLFAAAKRSGAIDVLGVLRGTGFSERRRLVAWLAENYPDHLDRVPQRLEPAEGGAGLGTLRRLRLAYGFPSPRAGRG